MGDRPERVAGVDVNRASVEMRGIRWTHPAPCGTEQLYIDWRYSDTDAKHRGVVDVEKRRVAWRDPGIEHPNRTLLPHETVPRLAVDRNRALGGEDRDRKEGGQESSVYRVPH